jgi:hypothetical protein
MRSAAAVLSGFCAMGLGSQRTLQAPALGSASHVALETGCQATRDAEAEVAAYLEEVGPRGSCVVLCLLLPVSALCSLWTSGSPPCHLLLQGRGTFSSNTPAPLNP